jgi:hypothetical protein
MNSRVWKKKGLLIKKTILRRVLEQKKISLLSLLTKEGG